MAPKKKASSAGLPAAPSSPRSAASTKKDPKVVAKAKKGASASKKKKAASEGTDEGAEAGAVEVKDADELDEESMLTERADEDETVAAESAPIASVAAPQAAPPVAVSAPPVPPIVPPLPQKPLPKDKGNRFAPGQKVLAKRSTGEEFVGFVEKFESSTKLYKVAIEAIGSGQFMLVTEPNMRAYDEESAPQGLLLETASAPASASASTALDVTDVAEALPSLAVPAPKMGQRPSLPLDLGKMAEGEVDLQGSGDFLTTARAQNEVPITVRGVAKMKAKRFLQLKPEHLGSENTRADWRPKVTPDNCQLAIASQKDNVCLLSLYTRKSSRPVAVHNLGEGQPVWLGWDANGSSVAVLLDKVGLFLWEVPQDLTSLATTTVTPLKLAPNITKEASYCSWSQCFSQLAIGTNAGKVIIFNKQKSLMQLHERKGKHGAPVRCGAWLKDNRLGLASGTRVKVSKPLGENDAQWESHSKFKLSGMLSRVPKRFKDTGDPRFLSFSRSTPTFVAVCIGDNYMLVFGMAGGAGQDLGLTFPDDYGPVVGFEWMEDGVVLVPLANGFITSVDFGAMLRMRQDTGLPDAVKATGTTKVFAEYLKCLTYSPVTQRIACVGDKGVKVMSRVKDSDGNVTNDLEVLVDHTLDYELTIGHCLESCKWDETGNSLVITSTNGHAWCFDFSNV